MEERNTSGGLTSTDSTLSARGTELTTLSGSDEPFYSEVHLQLLIRNILITIIALIGLAGNITVLWFLSFQMGKNAFSVYILNLASADFLYLFFQLIISLNWFTGYFHFPYEFATIMENSAYIAGLSILSIISTERCISVLYPIWYRCHRPYHISVLICTLLWALSLLLSILNHKYCSVSHLCEKFDFVIAAWLFLIVVLLSVSSLTLLVKLVCISKRVRLTRLYVTIGLTVLVFLFCGFPWGIYWFLLYWTEDNINIFTTKFRHSAYILTCVNSCANPIIYFFVGFFRQQKKHQRQNLKLIFRRAFQDVPEVDGREVSSPQETLVMARQHSAFIRGCCSRPPLVRRLAGLGLRYGRRPLQLLHLRLFWPPARGSLACSLAFLADEAEAQCARSTLSTSAYTI
ncbi:mas-related G-protein coupled receptor member X2-like [Suncus etruscus]|uniref:mas-related G-protein coupled receptor member X2-like n=1 Tax=Suncus etruscus TaxID=109475 RepID=UPI00210F747D|nr:mas-related G-protein coupled receptor member X2-like [Suncus etruscus]